MSDQIKINPYSFLEFTENITKFKTIKSLKIITLKKKLFY